MKTRTLPLILSFLVLCAFSLLLSCSTTSESYDTHFQRGMQAFNNGRYAAARGEFARALKLKPSDRDAMYYMGVCYRNDFVYDSAMSFLKRADILHPKDREILKQLYDVSKSLKDWEVLYSAISGLIGTGDSEEKYYAEMGQVWAYRDYPANALYYTDKAIAVDPDNKILYLRAADLANIVDGPDSALQVIENAIKRFGADDVLLANEATYFAKAGYPEEAEKIYRAALAKDSTRDDIRYNLALSLAAQTAPAKLREAKILFTALKPRYGYRMPIDSILKSLDKKIEH